MDALTRDDIAHSVEQTLTFYGKKLDKIAITFWLNALGGYEPEEVKRALMAYTKIGKYSPKPVDILELIDADRVDRRSKLPPPPPPETNCPQHIADAWMWFIKHIAKDSSLFGGLYDQQSEVGVATQERYLLTVNEQAKLFNQPESIPDEFKLKEVWA